MNPAHLFQALHVKCITLAYQYSVLWFNLDSVFVDNPYLVYNGPPVLQFNGRTNTFILDGLRSQYRLPNGMQLDGASELQVFYIDNGETVNGNIVLVQSNDNSTSETYNVTFSTDLPLIVDVMVLLDLTAFQLPVTRTISVRVESIGKECCVQKSIPFSKMRS